MPYIQSVIFTFAQLAEFKGEEVSSYLSLHPSSVVVVLEAKIFTLSIDLVVDRGKALSILVR